MKKYCIYLLLPALVLLVAGCDPDDSLNDDRSYPLTVHTSTALPAVTPSYAPTRASTYTVATPADGTVLHLFMPNNESTEKKKHDKEHIFTYSTSETKWISSAKVKNGAKYDVFGFMPEAGVAGSSISYSSTVTPFTGTTTMTLSGIKAANAYDVCFVVGASNGTDAPTVGSYTYTGKDVGNHLYLKLDHLFAEIQFKFRINADYGDLRKIRLNKVTLKTASISTVDVTIRHTAGQPVELASTDWTLHTATGGSQTQIFPKTSDDDLILLTTDFQEIPGYLCPLAVGDDMGYAIEVEYDVFDAHCSDTDIENGDATPIRANQKATNQWKNNTTFHVERGTKYTVNCTVNPTYLYQLTDTDLDSPVFTFE